MKPVLQRMKIAVGFEPSSSSSDAGKGRGRKGKITYGSCLVKGKANHPMEDYHVEEVKRINNHELGLFAIFDGHLGHNVPRYLKDNLFNNILNQSGFWENPLEAMTKAYEQTDKVILTQAPDLGPGGSTAVTAILIDCQQLFVANIGDSRAVICRGGDAIMLSIDHEPSMERQSIEKKGGFVTIFPGDVPRVDGQLAVARAFGDKNLKPHLRADPDVQRLIIDDTDEFLILASDGLWKVLGNQEAVELIRKVKDPKSAAKRLADAAIAKQSKDDISCIVVRFQ